MKLLKNLKLIVNGGITVAILTLLFLVWRSGSRLSNGLGNLLSAPQPSPQVNVREVALRQVRGASELTTAVFAMEAVVPASQDRAVGGYVIGTTKLLYIAYGEIRAGIDLSQLKEEDVDVTGDKIRLRLPPPRIIDSKIDVKRSNVYDYNRGFLGLGPDSAPQLQALAEQQALQKIVVAACNEGVLKQANDRAQVAVTQLLSTAQHKEIIVETQSPAATACSTS